MYGIAAATVALALGLRLALTPFFGSRFPYITLFPAVFVAAWFGGLRPSLFATVLGTLGAWLMFIPPAFTWKVGTFPDFVSMVMFADVVRRGLMDPGQSFIQKPFTPEALADKVRDLLDGR